MPYDRVRHRRVGRNARSRLQCARSVATRNVFGRHVDAGNLCLGEHKRRKVEPGDGQISRRRCSRPELETLPKHPTND